MTAHVPGFSGVRVQLGPSSRLSAHQPHRHGTGRTVPAGAAIEQPPVDAEEHATVTIVPKDQAAIPAISNKGQVKIAATGMRVAAPASTAEVATADATPAPHHRADTFRRTAATTGQRTR